MVEMITGWGSFVSPTFGIVDTVIGWIKEFWGLQNDLIGIIQFVRMMPSDNESMWKIIQEVFNAILPVGYTLLTLFFLISFFNKTLMFEFINWENIAKFLLRFVVAKIIIENSFIFLEVIAQTITFTIDILPVDGEVLSQTLEYDEIRAQLDALGFIARIFAAMRYIIIWFVMMIVKSSLYIIVFGRLIEICVYTAIAPIPLSTIISDEFSSVATRFIQTYAAVCLQGLVIVIMCFVYIAFSKAFFDTSSDQGYEVGVWAYILSSLTLLFVLVKSGEWAKRICGL